MWDQHARTMTGFPQCRCVASTRRMGCHGTIAATREKVKSGRWVTCIFCHCLEADNPILSDLHYGKETQVSTLSFGFGSSGTAFGPSFFLYLHSRKMTSVRVKVLSKVSKIENCKCLA